MVPSPRHARRSVCGEVRRAAAAIALVAGVWIAGSAPSAAPPLAASTPQEPLEEVGESEEPGPPHATGLIERSGSRLAQIDITVLGPPDAVATLEPQDLRIKINRTRIRDFRLDRLCDPAGPPGRGTPPDPSDPSGTTGATDTAGVASPGAPGAPVLRLPASYLLYFDQTHLTLRGRLRAIDLAEELLERLLRDGDRAMIVSSSREVRVFQPLTDDLGALQEALRKLEHDDRQWDTYAEREEARVLEVVDALNEQNDFRRAVGVARTHLKEEQWRADRAFRRLELTLGRLVDLDPPKAMIVFSDTLRANAGDHYMSFFGRTLMEKSGLTGLGEQSSMMGLSFDSLINEAAAQSIRLYGVQAEGLVSYFDMTPTSAALAKTRTVPNSSRERVGGAQKTLRDMAGETGGRAFLNGVSAQKIAERMLEDSACVYLASFDPAGFREDMPLRAKVETDRKDVQLRVRGRLVVQSESARTTSRLLRAFGSPDTIEDPFEVSTHVIPTGFEDGSYSVLLQFSMPGVPLHGTTWDMGLSVVAGERVHEESSGRLSLSGPGVPIVFEREVRLKPGDYDIVSVVHETSSGLVASDRLQVSWPDPTEAPAVLTALALLQPASGAFYREGETRRSGSLARGPQHPVDSALPVGLVGLVCGSRRNKGDLVVERKLVGASAIEFPPLALDLRDGRCAQTRDLVPAGTLAPGRYHYDVRLVQDGEPLFGSSRDFFVVPGRKGQEIGP